jgi:hypothetical protein
MAGNTRDATALHALFTDNFAGETVLLTDDAATNMGIRDELDRLRKTSSDDDLVVVAFSGHGSSTHALVPYDADPNQIDQTSLPLDEFATLLNKISASTLLCILDCFSGGYDAKVLTAAIQTRGLASEAELLEQIAGEGRIVFTASAANEPAFEDNRLGHGLLTYHLLAALQGAPEAVSAGKVDLYKLLEHVTRRVIDASTRLVRPQHPTLRGSIDGRPPGRSLRPATPTPLRSPNEPGSRQLRRFTAWSRSGSRLCSWTPGRSLSPA